MQQKIRCRSTQVGTHDPPQDERVESEQGQRDLSRLHRKGGEGMIELNMISLVLIFLGGALVGGLIGQYLTYRTVNKWLKEHMN